jgi:hypothetical protein
MILDFLYVLYACSELKLLDLCARDMRQLCFKLGPVYRHGSVHHDHGLYMCAPTPSI